jgi:DNA-binding transcriptional LysR family regulator
LFTNELTLLHEAVRRGLGIAVLPGMIVNPELASGALVQVLPGIIEQDSQVAMVYAEREFVPPQVRAFIDTVAAWAEKEFALSGLQAQANAKRAVRAPKRARKASRR